MSWLLVVFVAGWPVQLGPFRTELLCVDAGAKLEETHDANRSYAWACVRAQ